MHLSEFESMVRRLCGEIPAEFFEGIAEVVVSPRCVPDPERRDVYTLGECIPLQVEVGSGVDGIQSRVVLYHGSFTALAGVQGDFDWNREAWDTLTHELRHHLEWRAQALDLEDFDWAVDHNFARHDREPFDAIFFLSGQRRSDGNYWIEDDVFIDQVVNAPPQALRFRWHGRDYEVELPDDLILPCFLTVEGVLDPPPGDLVVVLRRLPGVRDLFGDGGVFQTTVRVSR